MLIEKEINGHIYEFEVPDNQLVAKKIAGTYTGYQLTQETEGYLSNIFMQEDCSKEVKKIGTLIYKPEHEKLTLYKHINPAEHLHLKTNSFGINNEIMKNLRASDRIVINDEKNKYQISVYKALKVGQYLHFSAFELQFFIPVKEFKILEK